MSNRPVSNAAPLLEVENLSTHYFTRDGVVKAVDGVDLAISRGEILGLFFCCAPPGLRTASASSGSA